MARIVLSKASCQTAPEARLPSYHSAGETVLIDGWIHWPGKPDLHGGQYDKWVFWQACDIDLSLIFEGDQVAELILSPAEAKKIPGESLRAAPFKVTVAPPTKREGS
jgi:hypothetical protein